MNLIILHPLPLRKNQRADQLTRYLAERRNNVHLILWDVPYPITWKNIKHNFLNSLKYKQSKNGKAITHKIRRLPFFCPLINKWMFKKQIRNIFKEHNIDIIVSESYINETEPPLDLPLIYDFVDNHEGYAEFYGSWIYKFAFKILGVHKTVINQIKKSTAVIVVSDMLVNYAKKYNKNVYKITNGVESWVLKKGYKKKKYDFGKHSLVYVSGFDYWANLPNLLYAIDKLRKEIKNIKLVLVGDGFQIPEGKKIVNELNLKDNVIFFGQINDRKELFEIINSCEICLNLSEKNKRQDSASSIKPFEYSALGKKIISTKLKEVELLNFPNILFYKEGNNKYLIEAIKKSFKMKVDKNKIKKLVNKYTWENIARNVESIIRK